jgi:hypothetical protein
MARTTQSVRTDCWPVCPGPLLRLEARVPGTETLASRIYWWEGVDNPSWRATEHAQFILLAKVRGPPPQGWAPYKRGLVPLLAHRVGFKPLCSLHLSHPFSQPVHSQAILSLCFSLFLSLVYSIEQTVSWSNVVLCRVSIKKTKQKTPQKKRHQEQPPNMPVLDVSELNVILGVLSMRKTPHSPSRRGSNI